MLKRRFLALLVLTCLLATAVAVPGAVAASTTSGNVYDFSATYSSSTGKVTVKFSITAGTKIHCDRTPASSDFFADTPGGWEPFGGAAGNYSAEFSLAPGTYTFSVTEVDPSPQTISQTVTVPALKPITIDNSPTNPAPKTIRVTGTAEPGKRVWLYFNDYDMNAHAVVGADGKYVIECGDIFPDTYGTEIQVWPQDGYDTPKAIYNGPKVTIKDRIPLVVSSVTLAGRDSLRVIGTGAPGASVKLDVTGGPAVTVAVGADGKFDVIVGPLTVGTYSVLLPTYANPDTGFNGSNPGTCVPFSVEVVAAAADDITISKVDATVAGTVTITGKAKAGTYVTANIGSYTSGSVLVAADGNYSAKIMLPAGTYNGAEVKYNTSGIGSNASYTEKIIVSAATTTPPPEPTDPPTGGTYPTLYRGMVNAYVTTLQLYLKDLGYYTIRVDGIYGVGTETGVRNFQIMNNLPATGIADDATQKLLYSGTAIGIGGGGGGSSGSYSTLQFGSRGTAVRNMQVRLANLGYYYGAIDGIFGSQTQAAVRQFQTRNNLAVTGIANAATQTAIYSSSALPNGNASTGYVYLQSGSRGQAVIRLQTALRSAGYNPGPIDGIYGSQTVAAVKSFQRANGLVVDGIAGRKTQNALYGTNY